MHVESHLKASRVAGLKCQTACVTKGPKKQTTTTNAYFVCKRPDQQHSRLDLTRRMESPNAPGRCGTQETAVEERVALLCFELQGANKLTIVDLY